MKLTEDNFLIFAAQNYNNPHCESTEEFYDDLSRFKYLKRLFKRYKVNSDLQERLILNHIIVLYNVFGVKACNEMMFFRMEQEYWSYLKTFLLFLNFITDTTKVEVPIDENIAKVLRKI
jgi:hypothetical protein